MAKGSGGTANKQERAAKKDKKAKVKAEAIIEEAVTKVKGSRTTTDEDKALGQRVKELRDGGMAWWQIGHELGLPGSADNVKEGKSGASKARSLYKKAFGELPATPRSLAAQRGDRVYGDGPKPKGTRKKDVIRKDPDTASMFSDEHSDEEIAEMLRGKRITYVNSISGEQDTVRIHAKSSVVIIPQRDGKAVQFRESHADDHGCDIKFRYLPAHMRTIILERIVRVAS